METLHHRLAAVWFADVVGYTRLAAEDEERALRVVQSLQDGAREVVRRYDGRIVKFIGDAVLAEFASTEAAVRAALRLKVACVERARRAGVECPTLRIGVHVGDVATTPDGDVYGDGVNLASRIADAAEPGEVWVSQDIWRQLRHRPRFEFEARGSRAFQGFDAVDVYAVSGEEGAESMVGRLSPAARARALARDLRNHPAIPAAALVLAGAVAAWMVFGHERPAEGEPSAELGAASASGDRSRVAVLYFDDRGEGRGLAEGLTEALIQDLSQVDVLDVISREGVKRYRDGRAPLDSVARALGAGTLIQGSVVQSGDLVRVTAQLIDAADMTQHASIQVQRPRGELFALQDELVEEVSRSLRNQLGRDIRLELRRRATASVEAWELVQRAERLRGQSKEARDENVEAPLREEADSLLARAALRDPRWVEPILLRGRLALDEGTSDALQRGLRHTARALAVAPRDARALDLRGTIEYQLAWLESDSLRAAELLARAEGDLRAAVAADPSLPSAWISLADLLYTAKWELRAARDAAKRAYEEDAFFLEWEQFAWLCEISLQLEDFEEAARWCAEGRLRNPEVVWLIGIQLAIIASRDGPPPDIDEAWRMVDEVAELASEGNRPWLVPASMMHVAAVIARAGNADSAQQVARRARAAMPPDRSAEIDYLEAYLRVLLDQRGTAIPLLRSFLTTYPHLRARVARDYWFEDLAGDPRFEVLVDHKHSPFFCQILCQPPPRS